MPESIIAQWLNLPNVEIICARTDKDITEIELGYSKGSLICPKCGQESTFTYDSRVRRLRDLSVFGYATYLVIPRRRLLCSCCGVKIEWLSWCEPYGRCTVRFAEYIARLCKFLPVKQVASLVGLDWKTVKEIDKRYLEEEFSHPDYSSLKILAIDEVSYKSGHKYITVVLDLERTRVVWAGKGRGKETLDKFFTEIGEKQAQEIIALATDMWDPYLKSISEHAPQAKVVFDKFHVIAEYSRMIDRVRNEEHRAASNTGKKVIKGSRYLLLKNEENLTENQKERLKELLSVNETLNTVYILKDELKRLWEYRTKEEASSFLEAWMGKAMASGNKELIKFAKKLRRYSSGLINHATCPINSAKLEGVNNKIKVIKRRSYGFRDLTYFILKIKQGFT